MRRLKKRPVARIEIFSKYTALVEVKNSGAEKTCR